MFYTTTFLHLPLTKEVGVIFHQVPTLATSTSKPSLPELNAVMRRIDLLCKLFAPIFISVIAILAANIRVTIFIILSTNLVSVAIESFSAKKVWTECERLQAPRPIAEPQDGETDLSLVETRWEKWSHGLRLFFRSEIWIRKFSSVRSLNHVSSHGLTFAAI